MQEGALQEVYQLVLPREVHGKHHDKGIWLRNKRREDLIGKVDGVAAVIGAVEVQKDIVHFF